MLSITTSSGQLTAPLQIKVTYHHHPIPPTFILFQDKGKTDQETINIAIKHLVKWLQLKPAEMQALTTYHALYLQHLEVRSQVAKTATATGVEDDVVKEWGATASAATASAAAEEQVKVSRENKLIFLSSVAHMLSLYKFQSHNMNLIGATGDLLNKDTYVRFVDCLQIINDVWKHQKRAQIAGKGASLVARLSQSFKMYLVNVESQEKARGGWGKIQAGILLHRCEKAVFKIASPADPTDPKKNYAANAYMEQEVCNLALLGTYKIKGVQRPPKVVMTIEIANQLYQFYDKTPAQMNLVRWAREKTITDRLNACKRLMPMFAELVKKNIFHGDIKALNVVCNGDEFELIDWSSFCDLTKITEPLYNITLTTHCYKDEAMAICDSQAQNNLKDFIEAARRIDLFCINRLFYEILDCNNACFEIQKDEAGVQWTKPGSFDGMIFQEFGFKQSLINYFNKAFDENSSKRHTIDEMSKFWSDFKP